jgi:hypothetical protein
VERAKASPLRLRLRALTVP